MFKLQKTKKDHRFFCGNKYEKYSIKKLKVGAASVLVGTGFLFGYNLDQVEANEVKTESVTNQIPDGSSNLPDKVEMLLQLILRKRIKPMKNQKEMKLLLRKRLLLMIQ